MEQSESTVNNSLVFAVDGKRFEVSTIHPSTTLLEFLRSHTRFKGAKLSCGEGGCGACVVLVSKHNPVLDQVDDFTVSSCLTLLCSINGCSITTTEGLGNTKDDQCGFCTAGMCMSLFSALVNAEKTLRPEPPLGFSKLKVSEAERAIAGNLCRCTGYRPFADACKSFAADVDMEDLGFNSFWRKGDSKEVKLSSLPLYNHSYEICTFPQFLKNETRSTLLLDSSRYSWFNPVTIEELRSLLGFVEDGNGTRVKVVVGNTGMGYYKEVENYDKYIDLRYIPELSVIRRDHTGISIGAAVTISKAIEALKECNQGGFHTEEDMVYKKIADHIEKVASGFIRNSASLGGNLVMAQRNHFPSDIATVLLAVGSLVNIMNGLKREEFTLEEFLRRPELDSISILISIKIPDWDRIMGISSGTKMNLLFETNCRFAFGAYGTKHPIRATKVGEFLSGKVPSVGVLCEAVKLLKGIVVPDDGTSSPAYRSSLAVSFLFEFFSHLVESNAESPDGCMNGYSTLLSPAKQLDHGKIPTLLSSAKQGVELNRQYHPVGDPIAKSGAAIQASSEAVYVDDIPSPTNCLHGAFIYMADGVSAVISFKDIPGENIGAKNRFGTEPLFADDFTRFGDFSKGMAEADHKILSAEIKLGSQYYFYMETQTALAVPDEDNCIVVYSSIQCPEYAHAAIARCLGIPEHNVRVITRRVGAGFGGKAIRAMPVATACALAAYKLHRPVRIYMNRKTDMIIGGGRHPMKVTYSVGFKSDGKITALHLDILINAGIAVDVSPVMPQHMLGALKSYDWGALSFDIKLCKTNHSSKSAMRAPGEAQATFISEAVIKHVASTLSVDVDSGSAGEPFEYSLPSIWDKLATSSSVKERTEKIKQFNMCNKWRKRGISRAPIVHEVSLRPTPGKVSILSDGSVAVEVGGIELGQGLWTKVKQMTAFALSSIPCDGMGDFLEKVRVIQSDTLSLIQGGLTAGSTTSESTCEAIRLCCNMLVERLIPIKEKLQEQMGSVKWSTLILQVEVNLLTGETTILQSDIIYDCGQSLNPAVDLGQIEGAFVQGIGFFMLKEYTTNSDGLVVTKGTWTYKIPTIDTIPKQFNVEILNSGQHKKRVLSSKASGEPPLLLAVSVHCATRAAIREARQQLLRWTGLNKSDSTFQLEVPATMPVVKKLCGLENVESYLQSLLS
ncbi:hypothetical protein PVL29_024905 [Vitis rotundifolia]|uniref:indole-3-acetaldehyde oxidase n=1 Tax=Vitis rotundifolia TaxID=103349 RepID=A0AA38YT55_VITRO|nr:hypothetical protein PVL29_024905 [Vitis rotundifolia]